MEGLAEFGAIPKFAEKLDFDFNINAVSIIPIENSYFVGMIKILNEFEIPMLAVFDSDVLFQINGNVDHDNEKIKVSLLFKQLDELKLLNENDKKKLKQFESKIVKRLSKKKKNDTVIIFLEEMSNNMDIPENIRNNSRDIIDLKKTHYYDESVEQGLRTFLESIIKNANTKIRVLDIDFEGIFRNIDPNLLKEASQQYGYSKVLQGYFIANKIDNKDIPSEIKVIIEDLKSFQTTKAIIPNDHSL